MSGEQNLGYLNINWLLAACALWAVCLQVCRHRQEFIAPLHIQVSMLPCLQGSLLRYDLHHNIAYSAIALWGSVVLDMPVWLRMRSVLCYLIKCLTPAYNKMIWYTDWRITAELTYADRDWNHSTASCINARTKIESLVIPGVIIPNLSVTQPHLAPTEFTNSLSTDFGPQSECSMDA